ncbi:MAG TPA: isoprenylcysteine carboxylmethyltransferase family protein [Candidatus Binatia bacterium]|nr:isoprenylcysteine carboxylmethyltransferase family protein [Candidatus Binatia bacterium]
MKTARRAIGVAISTAISLGIAIFAFGGIGAFFSHPPLAALAVVTAALGIAAVFAGGNASPGIREDRSNRWVIGAVVALGILDTIIPPWTDRIGLWTIDGDTIRWFGVALVAIGGALRLAPVFILGNRFSGLVAIQPGHTLVTGGLYGVIRHPSYLGLLLITLGWGLAFRSLAGVALTVLTVPVIVARIRSEEALLADQFGAEYAAYRARTSRLIPGLY